MEETINIPIDSIKDDFQSFLDTKDNSRIFFSGKFGIGKTYFLKKFFDINKEKYDVFHLFPVNYQISSNGDVVDLIKYDILVELLNKNKEIFKGNEVEGINDFTLLFYSWCKARFSLNSVLQSALSIGNTFSGLLNDPANIALTKLGRPLKDLLELDKEFQIFKNKYEKGEKAVAEKYAETIKSKDIAEVDYFSQLLKEKIVQQKVDKKSILILDDMDRLDPEHIFRILNILSAYFEKESENKFGFDAIIIVADYSNLKHIFHHKYGVNADFAGYLDKFFSISPYYYDNKKIVIDMINKIVLNIKNSEPALNNAFSNNGYIKIFLSYIFTKAIDNEIMNLRELLKATNYQLPDLKKGGYYETTYSDSFSKILDIAIMIAIHSFSNANVFIEKIKNIKENNKFCTEDKMPFGVYVWAMLRSEGKKLPDDINVSFNWQQYVMQKNPQNPNSIIVVGANQSVEDLFCDMLIEYVKSKKFIKRAQPNYEN